MLKFKLEFFSITKIGSQIEAVLIKYVVAELNEWNNSYEYVDFKYLVQKT